MVGTNARELTGRGRNILAKSIEAAEDVDALLVDLI